MDRLADFIEAMGLIAESSALLRDALIKNGFTREEAISLVSTYIIATVTKAKGG